MTLSFLQSTFLMGLAALAVPLLIHLFFRLKTRRVSLGTIRFLRIAMEETARRRRVMQWLLLTLRMLFVALLVGLFARPYLGAASAAGRQKQIVILIDTSATMGLKGDHGRLIDQAVREATAIIDTAPEQARIEVAFFDDRMRPVASTNPGGASGRVASTQLQSPANLYGATSYATAMQWARDLCLKAPLGTHEFHLFTDLQRSGLDWTEVESLPPEVQAHLHDLGRTIVDNLAVTEIRTPRWWVRPGESPPIRASITHGGTFVLPEVEIVLEIGRVAAERGLPANPDSSSPDGRRIEFSKLADRVTRRERIKLEPGTTSTLEFELPQLSEGLWQGRVVVVHEDDLPFDNERYFAISATPAYRILIIDGGHSAPSIHRETHFLNAALKLSEDGDTYTESPFAPEVVTYTGDGGLPSLDRFDAIVLANPSGVAKHDAEQMSAFVRGGGGLLVFTGDQVTSAACATLAEANLSVGEIGAANVALDLPWHLDNWDDRHPVFQPLSDPQHGDLRRISFTAYSKLTPAKNSTVLAQFNSGDPAVIERKLDKGVVLWVTTSCGREWSDWCRSRLYLPTIHQLLSYQVGLSAGGRVRISPVESNRNDIAPAWVPGIALYDRHAEILNCDPRESETDRCTRQEFEDRFGCRFVDEGGVSTSEAVTPAHVEFRPDELWHWVACALAGILLLEGFVGNRTTA